MTSIVIADISDSHLVTLKLCSDDGKLQRDELIQGYTKIFNHPHPEEEVDRILLAVDKNNSGEIDYSGKKREERKREQCCD